MKFRIQCSGCGATFFAPDRKARLCPKCLKKKGVAKPVNSVLITGPTGSRLIRAANKNASTESSKKAAVKNPKAVELTPELSARIAKIFHEQFAASGKPLHEIVAQISDIAWSERKLIRQVVDKLINPEPVITPELKERIIGMYKGYVERSERPNGGRRRAIADAMNIPLSLVRNIVHEWSRIQYAQSPTPELSRHQLFEIEKTYWDEIETGRYHYNELPYKIAERLGYVNAYQVMRWLDMLHDDNSKFERIADASPEVEQQVLKAYLSYLAEPQPPTLGLHASIASQIEGISIRQVHKILQRYRYQRREEYPLR